jgi:shikimate dehydrogenase
MAGGYLVGLIGSDISTSLTPLLHEREADLLGIRYLYRVLDLAHIEATVGELVAAAELAGYNGLNITHPVKQLVLHHLDELSPEAEAIGAVNTVVFTDGQAVGHNTDLAGFSRALTTGLPGAALGTVVLVGAGGAGAALGHALLALGVADLRVVDLDHARAERLAAALTDRFGPRATVGEHGDPGMLDGADGLVHATPTGMAGQPGLPVSPALLRPDLWVVDIVYRPLETEFLRAARDRGCQVLDGGRMAVFQAADTFRLITGREPDPERMLRHFDAITHTTAHTTGR